MRCVLWEDSLVPLLLASYPSFLTSFTVSFIKGDVKGDEKGDSKEVKKVVIVE
jgi:hypothetical protein